MTNRARMTVQIILAILFVATVAFTIHQWRAMRNAAAQSRVDASQASASATAGETALAERRRADATHATIDTQVKDATDAIRNTSGAATRVPDDTYAAIRAGSDRVRAVAAASADTRMSPAPEGKRAARPDAAAR